MNRLLRRAVVGAAVAAAALTVASAMNSAHLPSLRPSRGGEPRRPNGRLGRPDRVAVLLPVRDEETNIEACLTSLLNQSSVDEILVLDDGSTDRTAELAEAIASHDPRFSLLVGGGDDPPPGWLGKPWACQRLAGATSADVLVFVDADVTLAPGSALAATEMLRELDLAMLCPYPQQQTTTPLTRLVQPLLQWSWLTFIPYRYSLSRQPPSMAVGNGQFAVFDAESYRAIGGHAAVSDEVVEDVAIARLLRQSGVRTAVVDGHEAAACRMYDSDRALVDGYTKSLWQALAHQPSRGS